jgi:hypothetical protein
MRVRWNTAHRRHSSSLRKIIPAADVPTFEGGGHFGLQVDVCRKYQKTLDLKLLRVLLNQLQACLLLHSACTIAVAQTKTLHSSANVLASLDL